MKFLSLLALALLFMLVGCEFAPVAEQTLTQVTEPEQVLPEYNSPFRLKADPDIVLIDRSDEIDVNLGTTPKAFVALLWKQLTGEVPSSTWVQERASLLSTEGFPRRIDLAVHLAEEAGVDPKWTYSDPWEAQVPLSGAPEKQLDRDIGAVFMFFFTSPVAPNGGAGWANNHTPGMYAPDPIYEFPGEDGNQHMGYYHPDSSGFWYRELKDATYAGLDFLLLNVYGPDIDEAKMGGMQQALERLSEEEGDELVKLAMFDDTWTWGQPWFTPFWEQKPDLLDVHGSAKILYEAKWKPFFEALPRDHWYLVDGRPMIYFYNNNTLQNRQNFDRVLPAMKALFKADFGVEPWVAVDTAFNYRPTMEQASDSHFLWFTFDLPDNYATETRNGISLTHSMVRWDSTSRWNDLKERKAQPDDLLEKDDEILTRVLNETRDTDILVLATWNDLGEGTGINRSYDYFWDGEWKSPSHFMDLIRRSQEGEILE